jgi:hypothetical protein
MDLVDISCVLDTTGVGKGPVVGGVLAPDTIQRSYHF